MRKKNFEKLLRYINIRPTREVKQWLKRRNIPEDLSAGLTDDRLFAFWWVEQRKSFRLFPKARIRAELLAKGVKSQVIDEVLEESGINDYETAKLAAEKRLNRLSHLSDEQKRKKISNFLFLQGFSWEIIQDVIKYLFREEEK
jgi:regulatory protein